MTDRMKEIMDRAKKLLNEQPSQGGSLTTTTGKVPAKAGALRSTTSVVTEQGMRHVGKDMAADLMGRQYLAWAKANGCSVVALLLDKSGSMLVRKAMTIAGYNDYVGGLKRFVRLAYSFYQFDSESFDTAFEARPIEQVPLLTEQDYRPQGGTPLYDSVIEVIHRQEEMLSGWPTNVPKPRVVICIQTDGEDTSGKSSAVCKAAIRRKMAEGWQFQFLGASIDIYSMGSVMGIDPGWCMSYDAEDSGATRIAFKAAADRARDYIAGQTADASFTPQDRKLAHDKHAPKNLLLK